MNKPHGLVQSEGLDKLKKKKYLIRSETRNLHNYSHVVYLDCMFIKALDV
jgi:hypothetical protein